MTLVANAVMLGAAAPATLPPPEDRIPAGATLLRPADDLNAIIASAPAGAVFGLGGWAGRSALSRRPGRRRASLVEAAGGGAGARRRPERLLSVGGGRVDAGGRLDLHHRSGARGALE